MNVETYSVHAHKKKLVRLLRTQKENKNKLVDIEVLIERGLKLGIIKLKRVN